MRVKFDKETNLVTIYGVNGSSTTLYMEDFSILVPKRIENIIRIRDGKLVQLERSEHPGHHLIIRDTEFQIGETYKNNTGEFECISINDNHEAVLRPTKRVVKMDALVFSNNPREWEI